MHYLKDELYEFIKKDEQVFSFIQEAALDGLWCWDLVQPNNYWMHPKFWIALGYNVDEIPQNTLLWQEFIYPEDLLAINANLKKHLKNPEEPYAQTVRYRHRNGSTVWINCKGMAIRNEEGRAIRMLGVHSNVTEEKNCNLALGQANHRLKLILTHLSDISFVINGEYKILEYYQNDNSLSHNFIGEKITDIDFLAETFDTIQKGVANSMKTKRKTSIEYCMQASGGKEWFNIVVSILTWKEEKPHEIICIFQNISDRKETELALQKSEERFRLAIQATKDGLWEWNIETGEEFFSLRWCEIAGYEANAPEIQHSFTFWASLIHPEDHEYVMQKLHKHIENGEVYDVEYRSLHKSGEYFWQNSRGQSICDENGKPTRMVGFISDISKRKEAELKLKQVSTLYQTLLDNVPGYVVCRNYEGRFLFVNKEFAALFGKKPEEVVGLTDAAYGATEEEIAEYLHADRKVMDSGKPLFIEEETVLRKDGNRGLFEVTKVPLNLIEQHKKAVLIVAMDITERKKTEKALIESENQLLQKSKILSAIAKITENLLVSKSISETLGGSFDLIGKSTNVDRVYYFERNTNTELIDYKIEWLSDGTSQEIQNPKLHNMSFEDLGEYMPPLMQNKPYQNIVRNIQTQSIKQRLQEQNTLSILLLPIFVKNIFHGFIGFDDCRKERIWSEDELNTFQSLATNISNAIERIHNESIIQESENNFRQINETIEDVFWLYDVINRKYIYMSPCCEKVLGIPQSHFYMHAHSQELNIFEEDKAKFHSAEETLKNNDSYEIEYRIILKDGQIRWINEKSFAIRDKDGKFVRNSGICSDITEKKHTQAELKQLSLVAEKTTNGVLIADEEGKALWANQAYLDMFEIPLSELLNKRPRDIFSPTNVPLLAKLEGINGTNFTSEMRLLTYKGNIKWIELNNTIVTDENGKVVQQVEILTDTTKRKETEAKLAEERQLLRAIIDNVPINIYVKDLEGRKILANKSEYEFVGAKSEAEVLGKDDFDLYDGDIAEQTLTDDQFVIKENKAILGFESIIRKKDGTNRWILSSKIPLLNEDKEAIGLVGIGLDITERKEIEAIRQIDLEVEKTSNAFAQNIFQQENLEDLLKEVVRRCVEILALEDAAIYLLDESGTKLIQKAAYGNKNSFENLSALPIEIGRGIVGYVAEKGEYLILNDTSSDARYISDGKFHFSEISVPIILNGKVIGVIDSEHSQKHFYTQKHLRILSTISNLLANRIDRILAEEKVKESEERFRFIAENTSDGIFVTEDRIVTYASPSCEKILGYSLQEFQQLSKGDDLLDLVHPDDVNGFREILKEITQQRKHSFNYEYRTRNKNGHYIWREDNINIVYNEEGKPNKFIIVIRDTTEKVEKKQQLQHLLDVTSKQNERLMNFAHIVSHNIRSHSSNLSMIVNFMDGAYKEDKDNGINYFEMLKQSTEKLSETIENLNEIITIQNNINKPKMNLYVQDEIQKTLKALNTIILANEATIINEVSASYKVKGIASYMESIFLNLLTNALKYRAADRKPVIRFSAEIKEHHLVLSIQDNGLGIDLKMHGHKIFGMYKTFHKNADARGIGLFITKNQIEAMGGRIDVESEVGVGTTFKLYFYLL